jgi:uroporphyrinogen III methyltransferase/synthase
VRRCASAGRSAFWTRSTPIPGKVWLTGAGPGDPELITLKARRALEAAECIFYDHLANPALLDLAPAAEKIYVGKKRSVHALPQEEICALLIDRARAGKRVVRLKGGDPFLFGRGGEEAEALAEAGVAFEVIPGVTSPLGIAAYAGIPLTHREHSHAVTIVTGHEPAAIDWARLGAAETVVVLMGLTTFGEIAEKLIGAGRAPDTPAAVVRWGTRPDQQVIVGTLATLAGLIEQHKMKPPATIIAGEVVRLHGKISWYERLPLYGVKVVVTRAREQADSFCRALRELGAGAIELAAIEIQPAQDEAPLARAIANARQYDWAIFTSVNGVRRFIDKLDRTGGDLRDLRARICAIGPATKAELERLHVRVDLTPKEYVAESLLDALGRFDLEGAKILLARAAVARDVLPKGLEERGASVDVVEAYRTGVPADLAVRARETLAGLGPRDWVTFMSSSAVRNIVEAAGREALANVRVASIGPATTATARELGVDVAVEASTYTSEGLLEAILRMA